MIYKAPTSIKNQVLR